MPGPIHDPTLSMRRDSEEGRETGAARTK